MYSVSLLTASQLKQRQQKAVAIRSHSSYAATGCGWTNERRHWTRRHASEMAN